MKRATWSQLMLGIGIACLLAALASAWFGLDQRTRGLLTGLGLAFVGVAGMHYLMPRWWREHCDEEFRSAAGRRYRRVMLPAMGAYTGLVLLSTFLLRQGIAALPLRALVALLPVPPIALVMHAFLRYLRQVDEFQRQIELESIGVGALVVSMAYVAGGFLQIGKVIDVPAGAAMVWVFPLICLGYGLGKFLAHRRYR